MLKQLQDAFGSASVRSPDQGGAVAVVRPGSLDEAGALVAFAREHAHRLVPVGGGTKRHWTGEPGGPTIEMDTRGLNRVIEYSPNDMTIIVEAGITMSGLAVELGRNGQRVTLDPPLAEKATLGGVLAANDSGPIRFGFGTARDVVIGMSVIEPDGAVIRSGGKVVKNVAGYDLHKLYIGSFGTLGPIATVTLKLRPLPEARGLVRLAPADGRDAERMIGEILAGETRPTLIELLNARAASALDLDARLLLLIGFEENVEAVQWQCERVAARLGGSILAPEEVQPVYGRLRELAGAPVETAFKATMLSSHAAAFVERADRLFQGDVRLVARAGNGVVYGLPDRMPEPSVWSELLDAAVAGEGNLQIRGRLPESSGQRFGRRRPDAHLTEAVQRAFDPAGTFAPERLH